MSIDLAKGPERMGQQVGDRVCVGAVLVRWVDHLGYWSPLVLLGERSVEREYCPGVWDVLGGHLGPGETVEQALVRELGEETGVTPTAWWSLGEFREPLSDGDGLLVLHLFTVTDWTGIPHNRSPEEHSQVSWFAVEDACRLTLAHPDYPGILRRAGSVGNVEV